MHSVKIDEETYRFLQDKAIAFIELPGDTIKRLLGLPGTNNKAIGENSFSNGENKRKKRKTNLPELVRSGLLRNGQELIFQDYKGNRYAEHKAILKNGVLNWGKKTYSMSELAKTLLKQKGYTNDYVRGPIFWVTEEGKSVAELWDQYLENNT